MKMLSILVLSVLFLGACQKSMPVRETPGGSFRQLQGAALVLKQPLEVASGKARVFVQDGKAVGDRSGRLGGAFDIYRAHCGFEIQSVSHDGFTIQPETFVITHVQLSLQPVVVAQPIRLAAVQIALDVNGRGSTATYHEGYHFWLASETQPQVMRMSCYGIYNDPATLEPPSLQEIQRVLGEVAQIRS
jgi:hypothetical protein